MESIISGGACDTYAKIVLVALEAFASETPAAVRMRDIADRAGVNLALENYHFVSKKNLNGEIARMWRFTKNNSITECFHRKMKLIQRMAYGYRNFQNYRLRVLVLCGVFH